MFLTRVFLNPLSRAVRADVRDPEFLHKTVMRAFPDDAGPTPRRTLEILHRLDQEHDRLVLLIQSRVKPATERWPAGYVLDMSADLDLAFSNVGENPAYREIGSEQSRIREGQAFAFRLRANTTKKIDTKTGASGERRNGCRVPVRGDDQRFDWLERRADRAGFAVEPGQVRITEVAPSSGRGKKTVTLAGALFEGLLTVRNVDRFIHALVNGVGPAKAYGFGLLSIAPRRSG